MAGGDEPKPKTDKPPVKVPDEVPSSDVPPIENFNKMPREERLAAIRRLYGKLPEVAKEPEAQPGPDGKPLTLADLQRIAAGNSATLKQAASDVLAAQGALETAIAYPNPTVSYQATPSNDGSTAGLQGIVVDQTIKIGGKLKLQGAAAEKALENARLNLQLARSALATQVRNVYFSLLVAKETVRVTRAMVHFTDEVYLFQEDQLEHNFAASYDPAIFRAQARAARLAYDQAVQNYIAAWGQLRAVLNVRQMPLTEVAGRIDAFIPYYDYDKTLAYVLQHNSQVFIARNGIDIGKYNLQLAQVAPWAPDVDFQIGVFKEFALPPLQVVPTASVGVPLPIWDQNKGNIRSAEAALVRAKEEPHRVEMVLTGNLWTAYSSYRTNLQALEAYRKDILPDQIRAFRGVDERRRIEIQALSLADLLTAQQNLSTSVTTYLGILGSLWSSVVSVADLMQTDDLFQTAEEKEVPSLPDLEHLAPLPCSHPCAPGANGTLVLPPPPACPCPLPPGVVQTKARSAPMAPPEPVGQVRNMPPSQAGYKPAPQERQAPAQPVTLEPLTYPAPPALAAPATPQPADKPTTGLPALWSAPPASPGR
jgi:cobalt-zinc-cadmium efflux system outer membrane protein